MKKQNNKNYKLGFTLIELLVVVLIIGILASIALPQYKLMIEKAHIAQVLAATKSITQAQELFYVINGSYANNISNLDIDISIPEGWDLEINNNAVAHNVEFERNIGASRIIIISYYSNCGSECFYPGQIYCWALANDHFGQKLCKSSARTKGDIINGAIRWLF